MTEIAPSLIRKWHDVELDFAMSERNSSVTSGRVKEGRQVTVSVCQRYVMAADPNQEQG